MQREHEHAASVSATEAPSVTGFKQSLLAARGVRVPYAEGLRKKPASKRRWLEIGVDPGGFCVLRCFKGEHDAGFASTYNIMGQDIRMDRFKDDSLDSVFPYCILLEGPSLRRKVNKELGKPLLMLASTHREQKLVWNALKALIVSALPSGECMHKAQVGNTFPRPLGRSASNATDSDARSSRSDQSASSTGSLRKRLRFGSAFSAFRKRKPDAASSGIAAGLGEARSVGSHGIVRRQSNASQGSQLPAYAEGLDDSSRQQPSAQEIKELRTAVQCCRFLFDCRGLAAADLFGKLDPAATTEAETLKMKLLGSSARPSLRGCAVDVVADVLAWSLARLEPGLLPDNVFIRYQLAIDTMTSLDLDKANSPATAQAVARMVASLPVERVYVLRDLVALYGTVARSETERTRFCLLAAGLVVNSLRTYVRQAANAPYGILEPVHVESLQVLFDTLDSDFVSKPIFEKAFAKEEAIDRIERLCKDIPSSWAEPATLAAAASPSTVGTHHRASDAGDEDTGASSAGDAAFDNTDILSPNWAANDDLAPPPLDVLSRNISGEASLPSSAGDGLSWPSATVETSPREEADAAALHARPKPSRQVSSVAEIASALDLDQDAAAFRTIEGARAMSLPASGASSRVTSPVQSMPVSHASRSSSVSSSLTSAAALPRDLPTPRHAEELPDPLEVAIADIEELRKAQQLQEDAGVSEFAGADEAGGVDTSDFGGEDARAEELSRLVKWYKSRLALAPSSRNADLWKQEIKALETELTILQSGKDPHLAGSENGAVASPDVVKRVGELWQRCSESTADALIRRRSNSPKVAFEDQGKVEADEYLNSPMAALDDSDGLLQKVFLDATALRRRHGAVTKGGVDALLMGMLEEIMQLRLEMNEYQRGVVQRTEEKAREFEERFKREAGLDRPRSSPADSSRHSPQAAAPQPQVTSIWSRFISNAGPPPKTDE